MKLLLLRLAEHFQGAELRYPNPANYDDQAIRIMNQATDMSLYVYTYGQPGGCYGVDLEYPGPKRFSFHGRAFRRAGTGKGAGSDYCPFVLTGAPGTPTNLFPDQ
ncbi:MAG: hypothetical protein ACWA44_16210 [Thiotrichales bacterium]